MNTSKRGLLWPDFETACDEVEDYIVGRRMTDVAVATEFVRTKGIAVQAGGHVGIFPWQLSKTFGFVYTFEPIPEMYECLKRNTVYYPNILTHPRALGAQCKLDVMDARRGGRSRIGLGPGPGVEVMMTTIDVQRLPRCDLIYLDIEGYELEALKGAVRTIETFRPVIALEVLKNPGQYEAVTQWAKDNNYYLAKRIHSDWIFTP